MTAPVLLPDAASLETGLARLDPASADVDLLAALTAVFRADARGLLRWANRTYGF